MHALRLGASPVSELPGRADWAAVFAEDSEDELSFLLRHMNRTVELGHRQIARLAEADRRVDAQADHHADARADPRPPNSTPNPAPAGPQVLRSPGAGAPISSRRTASQADRSAAAQARVSEPSRRSQAPLSRGSTLTP